MTEAAAAAETRNRTTNAQVWALTATIVAVSTALFALLLGRYEAPSDAIVVPWWTLAIGFAVVESFAVHLHFRSESGSFSLLEIPLVFGLLFADPRAVWVGMVIGAAVGLSVVRRQPALKVLFNSANLSMHVIMGAVLYHWLLGAADPLSPLGWVALITATTLSSIMEVSMIAGVISLTERQFRFGPALRMVIFGAVVSVANAVQALVAVLVVTVEPVGAVLLATSTAMLFIAYRAYVRERDSRERVEFLYNSTRALRRNTEINTSVTALLDEATAMFRAKSAEFHLFTSADSNDAGMVFIREGGHTHIHAISDEEEHDALELASSVESARLIIDPDPTDRLARHLRERGFGDAMAGALSSDARTVGMLVVADRLGSVSTFGQEDLRLFQNLVEQSAVALENDQLEHALTQLRQLEEELAYQARYDTLTGLANRALFEQRLDERLVLQDAADLAVLYIDLDDFKLVNDTLGHAAGDALLAQVAERITAAIRPVDTAARLGGDEFAVLLSAADDPMGIARRIVASLSATFLIVANDVQIGASIGLAVASEADTAPQLLRKADLAMYAAKHRGKGSVVSFTESLQRDATDKQALQTALRKAVQENSFEVRYQPIVAVADLRIVGAEALVRWRDGNRRLRSPAAFIDEAERSGLITSVDRQVRSAVLEDLEGLMTAGGNGWFTSINISAKHLHERDLIDEIAGDLMAAGADPSALVVEVTESALIHDVDAASSLLAELRDLGIRIALDDFGTGYSSLSYLRRLPIQLLKIAHPFLYDLSQDSDPTFVAAITDLAHTLGFEVVAEGIETEATLDAVRRIGCDFGQGFFFARPMERDDLLRSLSDGSRLLGSAAPSSQR